MATSACASRYTNQWIALDGVIMNAIRRFLESLAFAGLKPGAQNAPRPQPKWLGPLRKPIENLLSGGPTPNDPLYLTNRTAAQKLKSWSLALIPCLLMAVGVGYWLRSIHPPEAAPVNAHPAVQAKSQLPRDFGKDIKFPPPPDVRVLEVRVDGARLLGAVQNTSTRKIPLVRLIVDLVTIHNTAVGAAEVTVTDLPPSGRKSFEVPIKQRDAAYALVRDISAP